MAQDIMTALLQGTSTDEDKAKELANVLRNRKEAADLFGMSTIGQIAGSAQADSKNVMDAAGRAGTLGEAAKRRKALEARQALEDNRWQQTFDYNKEKDKANREALLKKAVLSAKGNAPTASAKERQDYREAKRLRTVIGDLSEMRKELPKEAQEELNQPILDAMGSALPASARRLWDDNVMYDTKEAQAYKTRLSRLESKLSQLASGMAVTGFEMKDRQKWSPNAEGITDEERIRRMKNLDRDIFSQVESFEQMYGVPEDLSAAASAPATGDMSRVDDVSSNVPSFVDPAEWAQLDDEEKAFLLANPSMFQ